MPPATQPDRISATPGTIRVHPFDAEDVAAALVEALGEHRAVDVAPQVHALVGGAPR